MIADNFQVNSTIVSDKAIFSYHLARLGFSKYKKIGKRINEIEKLHKGISFSQMPKKSPHNSAFQKGDLEELNTYRPIKVTPCPS